MPAGTDSTGEAGPLGGPASPALQLTGLSKSFGAVRANDDVSITVERGEIHALLGENGAGKSTLMNLVFGLLAPDAGTIEIGGRPARITSPRDAREHAIGMVHQHFKLVADMTVLENIALALGGMNLSSPELGELRGRLGELGGQFNLEVDPDAEIETLSVGEQQRVEILKLLVGGAEILILDEPTAVLTPPEWEQLLKVLKRLAAEGRTIIFISHKLREIFDLADRCTVLRDGAVVGTRRIAETDRAELARLLDEIGFTIRGGEVLGVAGVDGNGQAELVDALSGALPFSGSVRLLGEQLGTGRAVAHDARIGVIPEDRHRDGVALELSVADNLMLREFDRDEFSRFGFRRGARVRQQAQRLVSGFDIRTPSPRMPLRQLSGGNQQKVVLARELDRAPRLLIAAQPTRGLDIGAMEFVYGQLAAFKRGGGATLLVSTELEEVLSLADRVVVMVGGRFVANLANEEATVDVVGHLMAGEAEERALGAVV